ncbi:MAG: hypothetical protein ACLR8Y_03725 [Alistipes indistinctus]
MHQLDTPAAGQCRHSHRHTAFSGHSGSVALPGAIGWQKDRWLRLPSVSLGVGTQFFSRIVPEKHGLAGHLPDGGFGGRFSRCMLNTVVNPMLNTLGGGGKRGNQLIQFGGSLNSISATIVPVFVGYLMGNVATATINERESGAFHCDRHLRTGVYRALFYADLPRTGTGDRTRKRVCGRC